MSKNLSLKAKIKYILIILLSSVLTGCGFLDCILLNERKLTVDSWGFKDPMMGPIVMTFKNDDTYDLDTNGDGIRDIWGEYRMSKEMIILKDTGGSFAPDCGHEGAYYYKIKFNEAYFTLISDQCRYRASALGVVWERKR